MTVPEKLKEKNYFFRLSKYENFLLEFYNNNPNFVVPQDRFNEVNNQLMSYLNGWIPEPTNIFKLYLKSGNEWKLEDVKSQKTQQPSSETRVLSVNTGGKKKK